jgi:aspartyl-tRNA(Asn)/glutamyl-tRNA(Gln) amidotransferase subunit C
MEINEALLDHLARLSRLEIAEAEKAAYLSDLRQMLAFVTQLQEVDTEGLDPLIYLSDEPPESPEAPEPPLPREALLAQAPRTDGSFIEVPKMIKK